MWTPIGLSTVDQSAPCYRHVERGIASPDFADFCCCRRRKSARRLRWAEFDGQNLLAIIRGGTDAPLSESGASQSHHQQPHRWPLEYIYFLEGGQEQLFDLQTDPDEITDLSGQSAHASKRAELTRLHQERGSDVVKNFFIPFIRVTKGAVH